MLVLAPAGFFNLIEFSLLDHNGDGDVSSSEVLNVFYRCVPRWTVRFSRFDTVRIDDVLLIPRTSLRGLDNLRRLERECTQTLSNADVHWLFIRLVKSLQNLPVLPRSLANP